MDTDDSGDDKGREKIHYDRVFAFLSISLEWVTRIDLFWFMLFSSSLGGAP